MDQMAWLSPEEFSLLANDTADKALEYINAKCYENLYQQMNLHLEMDGMEDEDILADAEDELKTLRQQESSLHRIQSGLQSRLKLGML
jgi:hypothetical protein